MSEIIGLKIEIDCKKIWECASIHKGEKTKEEYIDNALNVYRKQILEECENYTIQSKSSPHFVNSDVGKIVIRGDDVTVFY